MIILGIESTCDETGVGIVQDGTRILANVVASSAALYNKYGGIVPEIAAREQVRVMVPVLREALESAQLKLGQVDAIAVAYGPGLVGSLLVGVETAKTLSLVYKKPLIPVNHLIGHVYANWLDTKVTEVSKVSNVSKVKNKRPEFPLVALIVSGGHTDLILMKGHGNYIWLGGTRDDAAGEVFDKVARVLGLGYPGGPLIETLAEKLARGRERSKIKFPRPLINDASFDFSFSGLKTSVVNLVHSSQFTVHNKEDIAYEFQQAVIDVLVKKTFAAAQKYKVKTVIVGGGVSASSKLREEMERVAGDTDLTVSFPEKFLSGDNGSMIASAAFFEKKSIEPLKLFARPDLYFD
ncbi:MAG TPA: tRNA (adenosine(37)-N6)-threonylcarbamoyltransferase complex transferase subunit TsaD [Candidatus Saccharimonadales bacterium]|nr:tRNA (adenosine(37)-N6)-threonylcarbamoyltransferase complex transferase subunit TsaD [Candidatus Saccharimonadales bacterium]